MNVLLALGLLLSPASQLRPSGSAIGPGEFCFALWLVLAALRYAGRLDLPLTPAAVRILTFWLIFSAALSIGTLTTYVMGVRNDPALFKHDVQAYILVAGISFFCVHGPAAARRLHKVAWLVASLGSTFLALQLLHGWELLNISQLDPWYWDRFRGWSENPNQLALLCIVIAFISFYLAETALRSGERVVALACTILPLWVGLLTKSDSFLLVLAVACPTLAVLSIGKWLRSNAAQPGVRWAFAWICVLAVPVLLVVVTPVAYVAAGNSGSIERQFTHDNRDAIQRDAPERFKLWMQAVEVGISSGMLGLGPGPHLVRVRRASVDPNDAHVVIRHPSEDPLPDSETHNTPLDLFTQGGLLAAVSFGWLYVTAFLITVRARLASLTALLCGLAVFSTFHLIIRHPLLWFVIAICLVLAAVVNRHPAQTGHGS